jgi:hypothetical protein
LKLSFGMFPLESRLRFVLVGITIGFSGSPSEVTGTRL